MNDDPTWGRRTPPEKIPDPPAGRCNEAVVREWQTWNLARPMRVASIYAYCSRKAMVGKFCTQHAKKRRG